MVNKSESDRTYIFDTPEEYKSQGDKNKEYITYLESLIFNYSQRCEKELKSIKIN